MKKKILLYLAFLCLSISFTLQAQKPNHKFRSINQADGLINSTVQVIFEDSYGFIWLGTHQGAQRYDGQEFKDYTHHILDTNGLSHNYVNIFCEDSHGNVWIGTGNGLNKYVRSLDKVIQYRFKNEFKANKQDLSIRYVHADETDKEILWISMENVGIVRLNIKTDSTTIYPFDFYESARPGLIAPHPTKSDRLLIGHTELVEFDKSNGETKTLFELDQNAEPANHTINDLAFDPNDKNVLWLATGDYWGRGTLGGLIRVKLDSGEQMIYSIDTRESEFTHRHVLSLCFSDPNSLWVGTRNAGVMLFDIPNDRFYSYKKIKFDETSLCTPDAIRDMILDRSGTLWFGTWGDGISVLSPSSQKFSHHKHVPNKDGLTDNDINSFTEDKNGNIWIATVDGGLNMFNPKTKTFEAHCQDFSAKGTNPSVLLYVFCDSRNNIWIGTYNNALYRYNPETRERIHYPVGTGPRNVSQKRVSCFAELKEGEILISTYGGGLNIYDYATDSFTQYMNDPEDSTSIPDNQIWLPFLGDDGNYYFSGNSVHHLIQFNPKTGTFKKMQPEGQMSTFMMAAKGADGIHYLNQVSEGLSALYIGENLSVKTVYDSEMKNFRNVESLLTDDHQRLWMATGNGLFMYNPESGIRVSYTKADGLQGNEFNRLAGFKASTGEMYFGGTNGFNVFHPDSIRLSSYVPPVVFTGFQLFQKEVKIGQDSPLKKSITLTDTLVLSYKQNDFSISFAALDFSNPENIQYRYILENHDEEWIESRFVNKANYTNMDPGSYIFKVRASNGDGVWNEEVKSIVVIILPPWWRTWWAYVVYGVLVLIALLYVDRFQRRRLLEKARNRMRERELEQAKKIEQAYHELKATQQQLIQSEKMASLGELTAGIAHEIQNPLNFVNNFAEINTELIEEMKQELENGKLEDAKALAEDISENEKKISHHGKRADAIVKGMLQHSRQSNGTKEPTDINALADEYLRLAYHGLRAKDKSFNATLHTHFDENIGKVNVVPQEMGRVILNLITNAFHAVKERAAKMKAEGKEGFEPTVAVATKKEGNRLVISVTDNGGGIPEHIKDKIFQPFFTTKPTGQGTGLGLSLAYDIVKAHGGELKIDSKPNEGCTFEINLSLNSANHA